MSDPASAQNHLTMSLLFVLAPDRSKGMDVFPLCILFTGSAFQCVQCSIMIRTPLESKYKQLVLDGDLSKAVYLISISDRNEEMFEARQYVLGWFHFSQSVCA